MFKYKYEIYSKRNSKAKDKPNEDLAVFDKELSVGMVLDGVSRDRENGIYPDPSPAQVAVQLFAEAALKAAKTEAGSGIKRIQSMVYSGNNVLKNFNNELKHRFPAGTVGIVFSIEEGKVHYGYIGDCYAAIIRDGMMGVFTECQTTMVAKHKKEFSSDEIRFDICNHINHPCGYGVWDGNENAIDFVKYGTISVLEGDVFLIYTDGMQKIIEEKNLFDLMEGFLDTFEEAGSDVGLDDRTYIRIIFEKSREYT